MRLEGRAPLRIDFAGGWTDVPMFAELEGGAVLNAAITVYVRGSISRPDQTGWIRRVRGNRSYTGYSLDAPSGAGLGASAAQTVLWAALLRTSLDNSASRAQIAEIACSIKDALGIVGGKQDEYASALGGVGFYRFTDVVSAERVALTTSTALALRRRLVLVYTGTSRVSSTIHTSVWDRYRAGDANVISSLRSLKQIAEDMKSSLECANLDEFGRLLSENWDRQRSLHPSVSSTALDQVIELGSRSGAMGAKACGAGGGGCALFMSRDGEEQQLRAGFEAAGIQIIEFDFDTYGVYVNKG